MRKPKQLKSRLLQLKKLRRTRFKKLLRLMRQLNQKKLLQEPQVLIVLIQALGIAKELDQNVVQRCAVVLQIEFLPMEQSSLLRLANQKTVLPRMTTGQYFQQAQPLCPLNKSGDSIAFLELKSWLLLLFQLSLLLSCFHDQLIH